MNLGCDIDSAARRMAAEDFFLQGYNCCQSVLLTFSDVVEEDEALLKRIGSGFGGGMGRIREVCGAVSAMTVMAGFISPFSDPSDREAKRANYALVQKFAGRFKEEKGSIVCRELLGLRVASESPVPSERTREYYHSRPCVALVGLSAAIVADYLNELKHTI